MSKDPRKILEGRKLLDLVEGVVVVLDPSGCVVGINRIGCDILGTVADKVVGHNWFENFVAASERQNSLKCFEQTLTGELTPNIYVENCLVTSEGISMTFRWNNTLLRDQKGNIHGVLAFGSQAGLPQDIRETLRKTDDKFEEYEKSKSEFVITVSHELRTPLTIFKNIISNALAGSSGNIRPKLQRELTIASEAVDRLAGIISDFLDISRIEMDKLQLRPTPIIIQSVLKDVVELHHSIINNNNMVIEYAMPGAALFVKADYDKMMQVFGNLIENAAKFVPDCGGQLIIRVNDAGNDVAIEIEDNGPGIEIDDINRVFGRFIQIGRHVGAGAHGTGLGLAIAKELVEMNGGRIWAENVPAGGAKFTILLPKYSESESLEPEFAESGVDELLSSFKSQVDVIRQLCTTDNAESEPEDGAESEPEDNAESASEEIVCDNIKSDTPKTDK